MVAVISAPAAAMTVTEFIILNMILVALTVTGMTEAARIAQSMTTTVMTSAVTTGLEHIAAAAILRENITD